MGKYNIFLDTNTIATVTAKKTGCRKKSLLNSFKNKIDLIVYSVVVEDNNDNKKEYTLNRTLEGEWLLDEEEDSTGFAIKIAIEEYEHSIGKDAFKELF